jgi:hypothetical protein
MLVLLAASLAGACTAHSDPAPIPAPAPVLAADPESAPAPVPLPAPAPDPDPPPAPAGGCHPTLRAACFEFDGVDYDDEEIEDCRKVESGRMPDRSTHYHLVDRWWNDVTLVQLLVLESDGCFTLIGALGSDNLHTHVKSTRRKTLDLDGDGKDEAVFRIVEVHTDGDTLVSSTHRSARYCRETAGKWTCTDVLDRRPGPTDWAE